jgi:hypothetical protein
MRRLHVNVLAIQLEARVSMRDRGGPDDTDDLSSDHVIGRITNIRCTLAVMGK